MDCCDLREIEVFEVRAGVIASNHRPLETKTAVVNMAAFAYAECPSYDVKYGVKDGETWSNVITRDKYVEVHIAPTHIYTMYNADFEKAFGLPAPHKFEEEEKQ